MRNRIINLNSTGSFQTLGTAENFPRDTFWVRMRVRASVAMQYRYAGQTDYFTVDAGDTVVLGGDFKPGNIEVQAANGNVIEIECSTLQYGEPAGY